MQRILDDLSRREAKPLVHTDIRELRRQQHLNKDTCLVARVLDVMPVWDWDVADLERVSRVVALI